MSSTQQLLDAASARLTDNARRVTAEERALIQARSLAEIEQKAIEAGNRYPTFWDRYNELRQQLGLPPAPRPIS